MLRSAVLHFYDTLSLRAPSLCTAVALTWIRALWGVEIKREPCLGAAKSHQKGSQNLTFKYCCLHVRLCMKSRRWHLCVHEWRSMRIQARKKHLGVYTFACEVCLPRGEGLSSFNYSAAKTLHVPSRASQPTEPDTLLRGWSRRKQIREEAWYTHFMGSSTDQLFKYNFLAANHVFH